MNNLSVIKIAIYFACGAYVGLTSLSYQLYGAVETAIGVGSVAAGAIVFVTRLDDAFAQRSIDFGWNHAKAGFVDWCFGRGLWTVSNTIAEFVLGNTIFPEEEHQQKIIGYNHQHDNHN